MCRAAILLLALCSFCNAADQWLRITTSHFELYTTAGEKAGRDAIRHFEQVRGFFQKVSPARTTDDFPIRIIAFNGKDQFLPYSPNALTVAFYLSGARCDYIVMSDLSPGSYQVAVHEYMHLVVRHSGLRIPLWLNEGWADVYSSLRPVQDGVAVGDLIPGRMQALSRGPWFDFNTLTSVGQGSPVYNQGEHTGLFYAESWALAHMLFLAPDYKDKFGQFVTALHRGSSAAEACQTAYGKTSEEVFQDLRKYFDRKKLFGAVFKTTLAKADMEPAVGSVAAFDSRLMLADLLVAAGRSELAQRAYTEMEKTEPGQPDLLQALGYFALSRQDAAKAREYFASAFEGGVSDPRMCLSLAALESAARQPPAKVIPILERAVQAKPDYADALLQLGVLRVAARQFEGGIHALMSIRNITPERATGLFYPLAYAYLQTGDLPRARENAVTARKWAKTSEQAQQLDRVLEFIEARARLPSPPHPGEKLATIEGTVRSLDCSAGGNRLRVETGGRELAFSLPDPKAIEFSSAAGAGLSLQCGPQEPLRVVLEYAPDSVIGQGNTGVVRRLEY